MRVYELSVAGIVPARPAWIENGPRGPYWRFHNGQDGRGRKRVWFPLGLRDFPADSMELRPPAETEYRLVPVCEGRHHILVRAQEPDGLQMVLWHLSPGYRGSASYTMEGQVTLLAEGREAQGAAGRMGGAPCPVVLVSGPAVLRWHRTGRLYGSEPSWRAVYDGSTWTVMPEDDQHDALVIAMTY